MGTYSTSEWLEMYGGLPEPGEAYPDDPDALRDIQREEADWEREVDERIIDEHARGERRSR